MPCIARSNPRPSARPASCRRSPRSPRASLTTLARTGRVLASLAACGVIAAWSSFAHADEPSRPGVSVALLTYGPDARTGRCFSESFLDVIRRETTVAVDRPFLSVALGSPELFDHPFVIFSGENAFELSDAELANLAAYLRGGGFVLASAGCSNHAWAVSFERAIRKAMPQTPMVELSLEHPVFNTVFSVSELSSRRRQPVRMLGIEIDGRLALLYSPQGLNDTRNVDTAAPGECCCCGGDEIVGAKFINAGALIYAITP